MTIMMIATETTIIRKEA